MPLVDLQTRLKLKRLTLDGTVAVEDGVVQPGITPVYGPGGDTRFIISGQNLDAVWLNRTPTGALTYPVTIVFGAELDGPMLFSVDGGPYTTEFHDLPRGITNTTFANVGTGPGSESVNWVPTLLFGGGLIAYYDPSVGGSVAVWDDWQGWNLSYPPEGTGPSPISPWFVFGGIDGELFSAHGHVDPLGISPYLNVVSGFTIVDLDIGGQIEIPATPPDPLDPVFNVQTIDEPGREISWELPPEASGTTIEYDLDGLSSSIYQANTDLTFVLPGTGNLTVTLISTLLDPFNVGPEVEYEFVPISINLPQGEVSLTIDVSLAPVMRFISDPAGIYTLVPGKTHDTLYERVGGTTVATSINVAIPQPFGITSYIPEQD